MLKQLSRNPRPEILQYGQDLEPTIQLCCQISADVRLPKTPTPRQGPTSKSNLFLEPSTQNHEMRCPVLLSSLSTIVLLINPTYTPTFPFKIKEEREAWKERP